MSHAPTVCDQRGYHRSKADQYAALPWTSVVRCLDCGVRLWHNDPPETASGGAAETQP